MYRKGPSGDGHDVKLQGGPADTRGYLDKQPERPGLGLASSSSAPRPEAVRVWSSCFDSEVEAAPTVPAALEPCATVTVAPLALCSLPGPWEDSELESRLGGPPGPGPAVAPHTVMPVSTTIQSVDRAATARTQASGRTCMGDRPCRLDLMDTNNSHFWKSQPKPLRENRCPVAACPLPPWPSQMWSGL